MYPESAYNVRNPGFIPGSGKSPGEGNGVAELDTTEQLHFHCS